MPLPMLPTAKILCTRAGARALNLLLRGDAIPIRPHEPLPWPWLRPRDHFEPAGWLGHVFSTAVQHQRSTRWPSPAIPPLPVCFFFRLFMIHLFCCFCVLQPFCLRLAGFHFVEATKGLLCSRGLDGKNTAADTLPEWSSKLPQVPPTAGPQRRSARPGAWALSRPLGCSAVNSTPRAFGPLRAEPDFKSNSLDTVSSAMCFEETCLASVAVSLPLSPLLKYTVPAVGRETYGSKWKSERGKKRPKMDHKDSRKRKTNRLGPPCPLCCWAAWKTQRPWRSNLTGIGVVFC